MSNVQIYRIGSDAAIRFAARELRKYLARATGRKFIIRPRKLYDKTSTGIWLGQFADFPGAVPQAASEDPIDDELFIRTGRTGGIIAGANPRSVLLAVCRYLREAGFRWIRPGKDGEVTPNLKKAVKAVRVHERASYRHRGICMEGAVSYEHARDMVDWIPKAGMNGYLVQFHTPQHFFSRWCEHEYNPHWPKHRLTFARAEKMTDALLAEAEKRGLILHRIGHGWTSEVLGIRTTGWKKHTGKIPPEAAKYFARVNGKRQLCGGIAVDTQLCYGDPKVRRMLTDAVVEYACRHRADEVLHFWLADGVNSHCECRLCRDHRPADLYVMMLNDIDAELTRRGVETKIAFVIYEDLLWPPAAERIKNPDRFILMFAPFTRSFSEPFAASGRRPKLKPFRRNKLDTPIGPDENLAYLDAWRKTFGGECFIFDYHFWRDLGKDPGQYGMARVLHSDIRALRDMGLNGMIDGASQRFGLPSALGMTVMAQTLWNRKLSFRQIADDYFAAAFGKAGPTVEKYLRTLSNLFNPRLLRRELTAARQRKSIGKLKKIPAVIEAFQPMIERGMSMADPAQARSWKYLKYHSRMSLLLCRYLLAMCSGEVNEAKRRARDFIEHVRRNERYYHRAIDVSIYLNGLSPLLGFAYDGLI
ncbi:MAG: DUF4838 domain-containing protein [Planctomycetota bacterium]|nr:DUF4838 domain-containing protein [Planctomycetota bacterium]